MLESSFISWMLVIFLILAIPVLIYYTIGFEKFFPVVIVDSQEAWVIDRWGKDRVIYEGINRILPGVDKIEAKVSLKEVPVDPPEQEIITKDNINIKVDMIATLKITDPLKAVMDIDDYKEAVKSLVMSSVLSELGKMEFSEIQGQQSEVSDKVIMTMQEDCERWGIQMMQVKFESITPPDDIKEAMGKEVIAKKEQEAMLLLAQGKRDASIAEAEGKKIAAELQADSLLHEIEMIQKSMPDMSNDKILNFLRELDYIHSMKNLSSSDNAKFVVYPSGGSQPIEKVMSTEYMSQAMNKK